MSYWEATIPRKRYQDYDKNLLIFKLQDLVIKNRQLKAQLQASRQHLTQYKKFVDKYEQALLDAGVSQEEFLELDIPF